jgi:predicted transcriptional regulator
MSHDDNRNSAVNDDPFDIVGLTANIVSAYVAHNPLPAGELTLFIASVHRSIVQLNAPPQEEPAKLSPAVPVRKSVTPNFIISLEDGRPYKSLKRHLTALGLTPDEYRAKWSLKSDYPMVAASYSQARSKLAKSFGLGTKLNGILSASSLSDTDGIPRRRGRPRKAS